MLMLATAACCSCYIHTTCCCTICVSVRDCWFGEPRTTYVIPINRYEDFLLLLLLLLLWCCMCAEKSAIESESLIFIGTSYEYKNFDFQHVDSQKWLLLLCRFFVRTVAIYSRGSVTHSLLFFIHESCDTRYQVYKMYIRFPPHFFVKKCTVVPGTYVPGTRGQTTFFIHIK